MARKYKLLPYFLKNTHYPTVLRGVGDHLQKRRLDLGLKQEEVASLLGVNASTYRVREILRSRPAPKCRLKVIEFLGYDPFD
jgi:DNA-binding XRE family transcriptional regulator